MHGHADIIDRDFASGVHFGGLLQANRLISRSVQIHIVQLFNIGLILIIVVKHFQLRVLRFLLEPRQEKQGMLFSAEIVGEHLVQVKGHQRPKEQMPDHEAQRGLNVVILDY